MSLIFDDIDFGSIFINKPPLKKRPKCECGAWAIGCKPYMPGHSEYCDVNQNKTPISTDNPYYEKENK